MAPSIAAGRAGKARLSEHREVRVRAGARPARSAGKSSQPDVGETDMPGANGFGYFCRNKSSPLAREASGKRHGCRSSQCESGAPSCATPHPALRATFSHKGRRENGQYGRAQARSYKSTRRAGDIRPSVNRERRDALRSSGPAKPATKPAVTPRPPACSRLKWPFGSGVCGRAGPPTSGAG